MNTFVAVLGLVAAGLSAWAAAKSARAAEAANRASAQMTAIEAGRRLQELTPELDVRIEAYSNNETCFHLFIGLAGPVALRRASSFTITIRDDRPGRSTVAASVTGQAATLEQLRAQVWGPLRLTPRLMHGTGSVDEYGRSITIPEGLEVGDVVHLQLELTNPPPWTGTDAAEARRWWAQTVGNNVRLRIEASEPEGAGSWVIPEEVDISQARGDIPIWS